MILLQAMAAFVNLYKQGYRCTQMGRWSLYIHVIIQNSKDGHVCRLAVITLYKNGNEGCWTCRMFSHLVSRHKTILLFLVVYLELPRHTYISETHLRLAMYFGCCYKIHMWVHPKNGLVLTLFDNWLHQSRNEIACIYCSLWEKMGEEGGPCAIFCKSRHPCRTSVFKINIAYVYISKGKNIHFNSYDTCMVGSQYKFCHQIVTRRL